MVSAVTPPRYPKVVDYLTNPGILLDNGLTADAGPRVCPFVVQRCGPFLPFGTVSVVV
jgi:hypothetical protein